MEHLPAALAGAAATALAAACLAGPATRAGWTDAADGARKLQRAPVALAGGAAVFLGLLATAVVLRLDGSAWPAARLPWGAPLWPAGGLAAAFLVGLLDDLLPRGLAALPKLAGQALAGLVCAAPLLAGEHLDPLSAAAVVLLAVVAQNAVNTFDNADGAATGLAGAALLLAQPLVAPAVLALLPFNLRRRDGEALALRAPRVFLGDAGSHVLGMLVLLVPAAWPALLIPLLDLARLSVVRTRIGSRPWIGDRRHLAHRLEALGASPARVLGVLVAVAAPALATSWAWSSPGVAIAGIGASSGLFALAVLRTRGALHEAVGLREVRRALPAEPAPALAARVTRARSGSRS